MDNWIPESEDQRRAPVQLLPPLVDEIPNFQSRSSSCQGHSLPDSRRTPSDLLLSHRLSSWIWSNTRAKRWKNLWKGHFKHRSTIKRGFSNRSPRFHTLHYIRFRSFPFLSNNKPYPRVLPSMRHWRGSILR